MPEPIVPPPQVQCRTINAAAIEFSRLLHETDASVFDSPESALKIFQRGDELFRGTNDDVPPLTAPCNGDGERTRCWALNYQRMLNRMLNERGVELFEMHESALLCQTISCTDVPQGTDDAMIPTVLLWLLRQHQCIRSVIVNASIMAPHPLKKFWSLLLLSELVKSVELRDVEENSFSIHRVFHEHAERLTVLVLMGFNLSVADATHLAALVARNKGLKKLALVDLYIDAASMEEIVASIEGHDGLDELELTALRRTADGKSIARLLEAHITKLRLGVECDWEPFLDALVTNIDLVELAIVSRSTLAFSLHRLVRAVSISETLESLELDLDTSWAIDDDRIWEELAAIVGQARALRMLRITVSNMTNVALELLKNVIARNQCLRDLHFHRCQISCHGAMELLGGLRCNSTLQLLDLAELSGREGEYRELLQFMVDNRLCDRVSVCYMGCQAWLLGKAITNNGVRFRNFKFCCAYGPEADIVFGVLPCLKDTLTELSIDCNEVMCDTGTQALAKLFRDSLILENVKLDCPSTPDTSLVLLQGLAESRSVSSLTLSGWMIGGMDDVVPIAFEDLLRVNSSIVQLTVVQGDLGELKVFLKRLAAGLAENHSISELNILHGPDCLEVCDATIKQ
ncbi:uncharacterized protein LOC144132756 [Amblyomma americanum]